MQPIFLEGSVTLCKGPLLHEVYFHICLNLLNSARAKLMDIGSNGRIACSMSDQYKIVHHLSGATWWSRDTVVAAQSEGCGVKSKLCPGATECSLRVPSTEWYPTYWTLLKKDPLTSFEKHRVVIPVAGFSYITS